MPTRTGCAAWHRQQQQPSSSRQTARQRPTARRWSDVLAEFDYDIRRIWLDGTPEDRAVFTFSHPDVVEHDARLTAYEEQVCTA
jgi:hypothetical protein